MYIHTHISIQVHVNTPHPRNSPQQHPGSLNIRRETLDKGEGAGAITDLRNFPEESPRIFNNVSMADTIARSVSIISPR